MNEVILPNSFTNRIYFPWSSIWLARRLKKFNFKRLVTRMTGVTVNIALTNQFYYLARRAPLITYNQVYGVVVG